MRDEEGEEGGGEEGVPRCVQTTNSEQAHIHAVPPYPRGEPEDTGVWRKIMRATRELTEASEGWSGSDLIGTRVSALNPDCENRRYVELIISFRQV